MVRKVQKLFKTVDELYKGYFLEQTKEEKERLKNQPKEPIRLRVKKLSHSLSSQETTKTTRSKSD